MLLDVPEGAVGFAFVLPLPVPPPELPVVDLFLECFDEPFELPVPFRGMVVRSQGRGRKIVEEDRGCQI